MAKKNSAQNHLPEGFQTVGLVPVDGWYLLETGNVIQGTLEDTFVKKSGKFGPQNVYKIRLTADGTKVTLNNGEEGVLSSGDMVGIDEKGFLKGLAGVAKGREIFVKCLGKNPDKAKKGQSAPWDFAVGVK